MAANPIRKPSIDTAKHFMDNRISQRPRFMLQFFSQSIIIQQPLEFIEAFGTIVFKRDRPRGQLLKEFPSSKWSHPVQAIAYNPLRIKFFFKRPFAHCHYLSMQIITISNCFKADFSYGYNDTTYFTRIFKKYSNMTPYEYKKIGG